jgi:hypothetical protein
MDRQKLEELARLTDEYYHAHCTTKGECEETALMFALVSELLDEAQRDLDRLAGGGARKPTLIEAYRKIAHVSGEPVGIFQLHVASGLSMDDLSARLIDLAMHGKANFFDNQIQNYSADEQIAALRYNNADWMRVRISGEVTA